MTRRIAWLLVATALFVSVSSAQNATPSPTPMPNSELHRWVDADNFYLATRYRLIKADDGSTPSNMQQWQVFLHGRFKFDAKGHYSVVGLLATGNSFTGGWNATGLGTGDPQGNFNPKQLYFDAKPVKPIEVQIGGIGINLGENTEITGYDNDGYLTGERVLIRSAKKLYFDEVSVTNAFLGDLNNPNVFHRFKHLNKWNYHQFLVRKQATTRVGFSADYTYESGIDTLRQAVHVKVPELRLVDSLLYENYERIYPKAGYGFALSGDKKVTPKLSLVGGFTKISHVMLNSDRFPRGERLYLIATYRLTHEFSVSSVIIQAVGPLALPTLPRTRFELIATYNVLEAFRHYRFY